MILKMMFRAPRVVDEVGTDATTIGPDTPTWMAQQEKFIDGVSSVEVQGRRPYESHTQVHEMHGSDISVWAWLPPGSNYELTKLDEVLTSAWRFHGPQQLTALNVQYERPGRHAGDPGWGWWLVEHAWLLNENGGTIERIAP